MHHYCLSLLLVFFVVGAVQAQCPLDETVRFDSQAEVDDFVASYPNCTEIVGNLIIGSATNTTLTDIHDLSGFSSITTIGGGLGIYINGDLTSLNGLSSLTSLGGRT